MEPGYEIEPEAVGHATGRRPVVAIAVGLVIVAVVLAKPWTAPDGRTEAAAPRPPSSATAPTPDPSPDVRTVAIAPPAEPTWPAAEVPTGLAAETAKQVEGALGALLERAGAWGIGNAGVGPRMLRDEPWTDWTPVAAEVVDGGPLHVMTWPGTGLCTGLPVINDRPTLVAVTTPRDVVSDRVIRGWWTDGGNVESLEGSVVLVSPPDDRGISYLERIDRAPWPPGRYEFHVVDDRRSVSLTVCLTRRI